MIVLLAFCLGFGIGLCIGLFADWLLSLDEERR